MSKQRIYLAGPFFSDAQIARLNATKALLEQNKTVGYIYEPSKNQQPEIVSKFGHEISKAMHSLEWQMATYRADTQAIQQADVVVAHFDFDIENGNVRPDEGTIFEIGYAIALNKPVIIVQYHQDEEPLNLMLSASYTGYFWGEEDIKTLTDYDFLSLPIHLTKKQVF